MKIAVCIKQVPAKDRRFLLDKSARWIQESNVSFEMNEADAYALEAGLQLKEQHGGEVLLVSLGPKRVCSVLKDGLAKGADWAIHVEMDKYSSISTHALANVLGRVLQRECVDLVLAGVQSDDRGNGQLAPNLGHALGMPHATMVSEIVCEPECRLRLQRELEGGCLEELEIILPCVLSIQTGINKPRYAGMKGIMLAKNKKIESLSLKELGLENIVDDVVLTRIYVPMKSTACKVINGNDEKAIDDLVNYLNAVMD